MRHLLVFLAVVSGVLSAGAAWYWPFGKDDASREPRLSELMEPATELIDSAADLADQGKVDEAVAAYHKALDELARIELENPERAAKAEFATVRNKRAYIESAIDSLLLTQARRNAKAVSVTDTSEIERKFAEERAARAAEQKNRGKTASDRGREKSDEKLAEEDAFVAALETDEAAAARATPERKKDRKTLLVEARQALGVKKHDVALAAIELVLKENPKDAPALNMRALVEKDLGDFAAAEATLTKLIQTNPRVYYGYYNLAKLMLEAKGKAGLDAARRYYRTGREFCDGPEDPYLETRLK